MKCNWCFNKRVRASIINSRFIHKLNVALKEANETEYWLQLIHKSDYITVKEFESLSSDLTELLKILTSIIKTTKSKK